MSQNPCQILRNLLFNDTSSLSSISFSGASNLHELQMRMSDKFMIRRLKKDVLKQLPPKRRQRIPFELKESELKKEVERIGAQLGNLMSLHKLKMTDVIKNSHPSTQGDGTSLFDLRKLMMEMWQATARAKIGPVCDYIKMLLEDSSTKILLFAHHHVVMDGLQQQLWQSKVKFIRIDGKVASEDRMHYVKQFQSDPTIRVAILSIQAAGQGITLTAGNVVVFAELHWTPGQLEQCEDRAHRIGQKNSVTVHYLVARNTLDEWVWSLLSRKTCVVTTALNGVTQTLSMDKGDLSHVQKLSNAEAWVPSKQDEDVDISSFFLSQQVSSQKTVLDYFSPSSAISKGKGKTVQRKRKRSGKFSDTKADVPKLDIVDIEHDHDEDFKNKKMKHGKPVSVKCNSEVVQVIDEDAIDGGSDDSIDSLPDISVILKTKTAGENKCSEPTLEVHSPKRDTPDLIDTTNEPLNSSILHVSQVKSDSLDCTPRKEVQTSAENGETDKYWACCACTFHNELSVSNCSICSTPSGKKQKTAENSSDVPTRDSSSPRVNSSSDASKVTQNVWVCLMCTFENSKRCKKCKMCNTRKGERIDENKTPVVDSKENNADNITGKEIVDETLKTDVITKTTDPMPSTSYVMNSEIGDSQKKLINNEDIEQTKLGANLSEEILNGFVGAKGSVDAIPKKTIIGALKFDDGGATKTVLRSGTPDLFDDDNDSIRNDDESDIDGASTFENKSVHSNSENKSQSLLSADDTGSNLQSTVVKGKSGRASSAYKKGTFFSADSGSDDDDDVVIIDSDDGDDDQPLSSNSFDIDDPVSDSKEQFSDEESNTSSISTNKTLTSVDVMDAKITSNSPSSYSSEQASCSNSLSTNKSLTRNGELSLSGRTGSTSDDLIARELAAAEDLFSNEDSMDMFCDSEQQMDTNESTTEESPVERVINLDTIPVYEVLKFCASQHTARIHLFDQDEVQLNVSFQPVDIETENWSELPDLFFHPQNMRLVKRFLREWNSMSNTKKRFVSKSGLVFTTPYAAYEEVRCGKKNTQRYITKSDVNTAAENKAKEVGGSLRVLSRNPKTSSTMGNKQTGLSKSPKGAPVCTPPRNSVPNRTNSPSTSGKSDMGESEEAVVYTKLKQVIGPNGIPLCISCHNPVSSKLITKKTLTSQETAWQTRFCSSKCREDYWMKTNKDYGRRVVFNAEHGVCQKCNFNAQEFYNHLRVTSSLEERASIIKKSIYNKLTSKQKEKMVKTPSQGLFWHADHINPVYAGGGQCDIDNLRTLCTVCHRDVTIEQNKQRCKDKRLEDAAKYGDITQFFKK